MTFRKLLIYYNFNNLEINRVNTISFAGKYSKKVFLPGDKNFDNLI